MSVNAATVRQARAARIALDDTVDAATRALASAWASAWEEIVDEWSAAVDEAIGMSDGGWPARGPILRARRATRALQHTAEQLEELARQNNATITGDLRGLADLADEWDRKLIVTQLPDSSVSAVWERTNPKALSTIVKRTTQQVESLTRPLPAQQRAVMRSTLIRGVAIGQNPLDAADLMLERLHGSFLGGLHRAEVIARTEMLDAWRASGTQSRLTVGTDVLDAVMWSAQKSGKTCPACLAMDGTRFPIDTEGPNDHQCGRCSFIPVTKTWEELGFPGLKEPTATYVTGREWFDKQSGRTQERIMGAERLRRLRSGELDWDAMAVTRRSEAWRDSIGVRPLVA